MHPNIIDNDAPDADDRVASLVRSLRRVAVLGIKTEGQAGQPSIEVPRYMQQQGVQIVPVPVYYPEATVILGEQVYRTISTIPDALDCVDVFRRPDDIPPHVADIIQKKPHSVWFQLGISHDEAAEQLAKAGIIVVQDRCLKIDHARFALRD